MKQTSYFCHASKNQTLETKIIDHALGVINAAEQRAEPVHPPSCLLPQKQQHEPAHGYKFEWPKHRLNTSVVTVRRMAAVDVAVVTRRKTECQGPGPLPVETSTSGGGYLASVVTEETGCGSPDSPWLLSAPAGQTIQLRLLDFDAATRQSRAHDDPQQPLICQVNLSINK